MAFGLIKKSAPERASTLEMNAAAAVRPFVELRAEARPEVGVSQLFHEHVGFAWRMLRHFGVRDADLEDQTQEVFIVAHRKLASFGGEHPRAWLCAICRRVASAYRRRAYRKHEIAVPADDPIQPARDVALLVSLDRAIDQLDEDKRVAFVLHDVEELSMHEVAAAMDCPLQTAYARLYAARKLLAAMLGEEGS